MCEEDGGYYAIKGFLYQFDKTIIELLNIDENTSISVEQIQDINYEDYVIQVKHRESATYSKSKIRKPVIELIDLFIKDKNKKFRLYAYFSDKEPCVIEYSTADEIRDILKYRDADKNKELSKKYTDDLLLEFCHNFKLVFSENYQSQFEEAIEKIKNKFNVDNEEANIYHSHIRYYLFKLAIKANKDERNTTFLDIKEYIDKCDKVTFNSMYCEQLGRDNYLRLIKKSFFTFKGPNIDNFTRLFIVDVCKYQSNTEILEVIYAISNKYYRKGKSQAPYIMLFNDSIDLYNQIRRELFDKEFYFSDGTYFNGDKFRVDRLIRDGDNENVRLKMIWNENINQVLDNLTFNEVYSLYINKDIIEEECIKDKIRDAKKISIQFTSLEEIKVIL